MRTLLTEPYLEHSEVTSSSRSSSISSSVTILRITTTVDCILIGGVVRGERKRGGERGRGGEREGEGERERESEREGGEREESLGEEHESTHSTVHVLKFNYNVIVFKKQLIF